MKIIPIPQLIKGFFTFFLLLAGAYVINNVLSPVFDIVPTSMWKTVMTIGWYLIVTLAIIIVPLVVMIGPDNIRTQNE